MKHAKSHTYHEHRLGYAIVRERGGGWGWGLWGRRQINLLKYSPAKLTLSTDRQEIYA